MEGSLLCVNETLILSLRANVKRHKPLNERRFEVLTLFDSYLVDALFGSMKIADDGIACKDICCVCQ